jgi:hypothetical protein
MEPANARWVGHLTVMGSALALALAPPLVSCARYVVAGI